MVLKLEAPGFSEKSWNTCKNWPGQLFPAWPTFSTNSIISQKVRSLQLIVWTSWKCWNNLFLPLNPQTKWWEEVGLAHFPRFSITVNPNFTLHMYAQDTGKGMISMVVDKDLRSHLSGNHGNVEKCFEVGSREGVTISTYTYMYIYI